MSLISKVIHLILWISLLSTVPGTVPSTHAVLILVDPKSDEKSSLVDPANPRYLEARAIVDQWEWPVPAHRLSDDPKSITSEDLHDLTKATSGAEDAFINKKLKQAGLDFEAHWIPTSFWELFALKEKLKDEAFWSQVNTPNTDPRGYQFFSNETDRHKFKNQVNQEVLKAANQRGVPLSQLANHPKELGQVTVQVMKEIVRLVEQRVEQHEESDVSAKGRSQIDVLSLARPFQKELDSAKIGQPMLFMRALQVELDAHKRNQGLLWRGTSGAQMGDYLGEAIDFPLSMRVGHDHPRANKGYLTIEEAVQFPKNLCELVGSGSLEVKDLSYGYSLLAGYLGDGPLINYGGACAYAYAMNGSSKYTYALFLDKNWAYQEGKSIVYLPPTLSTDGIVGAGEAFHPRFGPSRFLKGLDGLSVLGPKSSYQEYYLTDTTDVFCHSIARGPVPVSLENINSISSVLSRLYPDYLNEYRKLASKRILLISNMVETWSSLLAERASALKVHDQVLTDSKNAPEVVKALRNQKAFGSKLREKIVETCLTKPHEL